MHAPLLATHDLSRRFGGLHAVKRVSLDVRAGELLAIIGPNGAGKTTFFNMLSRHLDPSEGTVTFAGRDITRLPPHALPAIGMARTFQRTNLFWELTVRENVRLAVQATMVGGYPVHRRLDAYGEVAARVDDVLRRVGLEEHANLPVNKLSHGDQRMAEIAIALGSGPQILLLDEPLAGMGPTETEHAVHLFAGMKGNLTMLLIEHDMDVVLTIADRIAVLNFGELIAVGTPEAVKSDPSVQAAYLGTEPPC